MRKAFKTVGFISIAILFSKALGLLRDILFAGMYGTTPVADAYIAASRVPLLFFDLTLGAAVMSTFIPVFSEYLERDGKERAFRFASTFFNLVFLLSATFTLIGMLFARPIVAFFAPGLGEGMDLSASLLVIMLPTMIFTATAYVFAGLLQSLGEFNIPAIISLVSNSATILYLVLWNGKFGIYGMAVAILIGWSLQVVVQIPSLIAKKVKYSFELDWRDPGIVSAAKMAIPVLLSAWVAPICAIINTRFASYLGDGAISALDYANRLYILATGVFAFAITNYIFPKLSGFFAAGDEGNFRRLVNRAIGAMLVIVAPMMMIFVFGALPLVKMMYMYKNFTLESAELMATALAFYSIGMVAIGVNEILNKAFYARKDGKTPMVGSFVGIAVNAAMLVVFWFCGGLTVGNLALSTAISSNSMMVFLLWRYLLGSKKYETIAK